MEGAHPMCARGEARSAIASSLPAEAAAPAAMETARAVRAALEARQQEAPARPMAGFIAVEAAQGERRVVVAHLGPAPRLLREDPAESVPLEPAALAVRWGLEILVVLRAAAEGADITEVVAAEEGNKGGEVAAAPRTRSRPLPASR